jgi:hypothetical protein
MIVSEQGNREFLSIRDGKSDASAVGGEYVQFPVNVEVRWSSRIELRVFIVSEYVNGVFEMPDRYQLEFDSVWEMRQVSCDPLNLLLELALELSTHV